jgi:hypothetical protein
LGPIKNLLKQSIPFISQRLRVLLILKQNEKESGKTFNYNTLLYYCIRNFKSSVKVARKSHVKKDEDQGISFKKTSDESVKK